MDASEVRLRCIEAAAKSPMPHGSGYAAGVLETAQAWAEWVLGPPLQRPVIGVPQKKVV